jgi:hypothetical protein
MKDSWNYMLLKIKEKSLKTVIINQKYDPSINYTINKNIKYNENLIIKLHCIICGYNFQKRINDILLNNRNINCKECRLIMIQSYHKLSTNAVQNKLQQYNLILVDDNYTNMHTNIKVKCVNNHIFERSLNNIIHISKKCPSCNIGKYFTENICRNIFQIIFNKEFKKIRNLNWLINKEGYNLELDGFNSDLKLAFEYNGIQHYKFIPFFHNTIYEFNKLKDHDKLKHELCYLNNVKLISIPYNISILELVDFIYKKLDDYNISYNKVHIDIHKFENNYIINKDIEIDNFLKNKIWERISTYTGARDFLKLNCKICNDNIYNVSFDNLIRTKKFKCKNCLKLKIKNKCEELGYIFEDFENGKFLKIKCKKCNINKMYKGQYSGSILSYIQKCNC